MSAEEIRESEQNFKELTAKMEAVRNFIKNQMKTTEDLTYVVDCQVVTIENHKETIKDMQKEMDQLMEELNLISEKYKLLESTFANKFGCVIL
jgi:predicted nuclease with TOPRIM domain